MAFTLASGVKPEAGIFNEQPLLLMRRSGFEATPEAEAVAASVAAALAPFRAAAG